MAKRNAEAALQPVRLSGVTFKQAAEGFGSANEPGWKGAEHAAQWTATLATYTFPAVGGLQVADITSAHVIDVLLRGSLWAAKAETASRVRQRIEKMIAAADAAAGRDRLNPARWEVIG